MVQIIKDMNELKEFLKAAGHKLVVVEFSAKWCGPCKAMCPIFHAMSLRYKNVLFANVDVDDAQELAETCRIKGVPTFQMFKKANKMTPLPGSLWQLIFYFGTSGNTRLIDVSPRDSAPFTGS
ncbi:thioredoxin domain-containing protein 8 isoform 2-T2 [Thomomys bottae]